MSDNIKHLPTWFLGSCFGLFCLTIIALWITGAEINIGNAGKFYIGKTSANKQIEGLNDQLEKTTTERDFLKKELISTKINLGDGGDLSTFDYSSRENNLHQYWHTFVDSDSEGKSTVRYSMEHVENEPSVTTFMRVHYWLEAKTVNDIAYVGIYSDFNPIPNKPVDISDYSTIQFKIRRYEKDSEPEFFLQIAEIGLEAKSYHEQKINIQKPPNEWENEILFLKNFKMRKTKDVPNRDLDLKNVFRVALIIRGVGKMEGAVDIDELKLK